MLSNKNSTSKLSTKTISSSISTVDDPHKEPLVTKTAINLRNGFPIKLLHLSFSPTLEPNHEILELYYKTSSSPESYVSDFKSPKPNYSFSPNIECILLSQLNIKEKIIEEIIESETNYVTSLQLLLNFYIEPIIFSKGRSECFFIIKYHLDNLHFNHLKLLGYMNSIDSKLNSSMLYGLAIISGVCTLGLDKNSYQEFLKMYEDILKLMQYYSKDPKNEQCQIIAGSELYLEAVQPTSKHMDLSFFSLMQRPVTRIPKYRLLIESYLKNTDPEDPSYQTILQLLNTVKERLSLINKNLFNNPLQNKSVSNTLNEIVDIEFPIEFFGRCLLSGSMVSIWVENLSIKHEMVSLLCFKSHLIVSLVGANMSKKSKKLGSNTSSDEAKNYLCQPIFIIPFSSMQISHEEYLQSIEHGGIITKYPHALKIRFEYQYCKHELLLIAINEREFENWRETLLSYTFINGPNKLNYSFSQVSKHLLFKLPADFSSYDVNIEQVSSKVLGNCYFTDFFRIGLKIFGDKTYCTTINDVTGQNFNIEIKEFERIKMEHLLYSIWSEQLPRVLDSTTRKLKNRKSWSWIGTPRQLLASNTIDATGMPREADIKEIVNNATVNQSMRRSRTTKSETDLLHTFDGNTRKYLNFFNSGQATK